MATTCGVIGAPVQLKEPNESFWGLDKCTGIDVEPELSTTNSVSSCEWLTTIPTGNCPNCAE